MNEITTMKTISSIEVAEMVGKNHKNLMRDIRQYISYLVKLKIEPTGFFIESAYIDNQNREQPCYHITKEGCDMIAHKLTGEKGIEFTASYVERFHAMENYIGKKMTSMQMLELQYQAMKEIDERVDIVEKDFNDFKDRLPLFSVDCEELQKKVRQTAVRTLGWYKSPAYNDKSIRTKVYQDIQHEIKREFDVFSYKAIQRNQLEVAMDILHQYKPPMALARMIHDINYANDT